MEENEKMISVVKQVLELLAKEYPEEFRADGFTPKSTQVMGIMQQL